MATCRICGVETLDIDLCNEHAMLWAEVNAGVVTDWPQHIPWGILPHWEMMTSGALKSWGAIEWLEATLRGYYFEVLAFESNGEAA